MKVETQLVLLILLKLNQYFIVIFFVYNIYHYKYVQLLNFILLLKYIRDILFYVLEQKFVIIFLYTW